MSSRAGGANRDVSRESPICSGLGREPPGRMFLGLCVTLFPVAIMAAPLSGTYTVKPDGTGDFVTLGDASDALEDSGICGDCVFELHGDTVIGYLQCEPLPGSDSWSITFRPGPGQKPVLYDVSFVGVDHLKLQSLDLRYGWVYLWRHHGCRISGCRFLAEPYCITLEGCSFDTIDGNFIHSEHDSEGWLLHTFNGHDNLIANNIIDCDPMRDVKSRSSCRISEPDSSTTPSGRHRTTGRLPPVSA